MAWRELTVVVSRGSAEPVSALLHLHGASGVQEDWLAGEAPAPRQPWDTGPEAALPDRVVLRGWFEDPYEAAVIEALAAPLREDSRATRPEWSDVVEVDYEAVFRAQFQPIVVSDRVTICPPWDVSPGALIIEPGQGFGTGDHPTTKLALRELDRVVSAGQTVLDVGAGSGILALAVQRWGAHAIGIDIDPASVADAQANAAANNLDVPFSTTALRDVPGTFDVVVANVHAEVLVTMVADLVSRTGHTLILGGVLADREPLVRAAFDHVLTLERREQDEDWVGLTYRAA